MKCRIFFFDECRDFYNLITRFIALGYMYCTQSAVIPFTKVTQYYITCNTTHVLIPELSYNWRNLFKCLIEKVLTLMYASEVFRTEMYPPCSNLIVLV